MKRNSLRALLLVALCTLLSVGCQTPSSETTPRSTLALDAPIRPGLPGVHPFWNAYAKRFIYAPVLHFETAADTAHLQFILTNDAGDTTRTWETETSWGSLAPFWKDIAPGNYRLDAYPIPAGAAPPLGTRTFIKSPPFSQLPDTTFDYAAQGMRSLEALLQDARAQTWLTAERPNAEYPLWVHPTKIMGGLVRGMVLLATLTTEPEQAREATEIARRAADFLLAMREPAGTPLAYWPPTYWDGVPREKHPIFMGQHMTVYPAEGAEALLDLFDHTADPRYFEAVLDIFQTYRRLQRDDGTWYLLLHAETGEPVKQNALIPTRLIRLLDRMARQYGIHDFQDMRDRAFAWCLKNPTELFAWEAQFEDTRPKSRYRNMSHREAAELALLLLPVAPPGTPEYNLAFDLMRYVEDQFVVWSLQDAVLWTNFFREGSGWNGNDPVTGKDWFLPSATEQYAFFTPIAAATATVVEMYLAAFRRTGEPHFRQRAVALANAIVAAQQYHGNGEIPTHLRRTLPELNWINVGVNTATVLIRHADALAR